MNDNHSIQGTSRPGLPLLLTLLLALAPSVDAQTKTVTTTWTGAADSNWLNPANWSTGSVPGSGSRVGFQTGSATSLLLANTGTADAGYTVGGFAITPSTKAYTLTLQGNSSGWLDLEVDDLGFYSVNNKNTDLAMNVVLESYSRLTYTGATGNTGTTRASGFWGANIKMLGNSELDISGSAVANVNFASLDTTQDTTITTGTRAMTINNNSTLGGTINSGVTSGEAIRFWSTGDGSVLTDTGVINLSGSAYLFLRQGVFLVNGVVNGDIRTHTASSPVLGGTGVVNGDVLIQSGGAITGGTSGGAGTLTVNGTLTVASGGTVSLDFVTTSLWDQLVVNGTLDLSAGGTLSAGIQGSGFVVKNSSYKILTVNGDLIGDFAEFETNFGVTSDVSYEVVEVTGGYEVWLEILRKSFASVTGITPNQVTVGKVLDALGSAAPDALVLALDSQITASAYGKVINQVTPQAYQAWFPAAVVQASVLGTSIEQRLAVPDRRYRETKKLDFYMQGSRFESTVSATDYNEYYDFEPQEIMVGMDYALSPSLLAGVVYAHDQTDFDLDDSGSSGDSESNTLSVYGRYRANAFQASVLGFYGRDTYSAERSVQLTGLGTYATADTDGRHYGGRALVSYNFHTPWFEVAPTARLQYLEWKAAAFQEGGDANDATLSVGEQSAESMVAAAGLQFARSFSILRNKAVIRPFLNVYSQHELKTGQRALSATLLGESYTIYTAAPKKHGLYIEGGFTVDYHSGLSVFASYSNDSDNSAIDQTVAVRAGLGYRF